MVASLGVWWLVDQQTVKVDCSQQEAADFSGAGIIADACHVDVEVLSERTPWFTTYQTAEGDTRFEASAAPVRTQVDGEWTEIDPSFTVAESGEVTVVAPVAPMEFNPGGEAGRGLPLGSLEIDGHTMKVWFPLDLPEPEVTESRLVYAIDEGIRLVVSVSVDVAGFLPVVELADPTAAARFAVLLQDARSESQTPGAGFDMGFVTEVSEGLTLTIDEDSQTRAVDADGETQFYSPRPIMWDSSGGLEQFGEEVTEVGPSDRTRFPAGGDQIREMTASLSGQTIVISPDAELLSDPETVWPVYIDPTYSVSTAAEWVAVRTGGYSSTLYKWGDLSATKLGQGTGRCNDVSCNTDFTQRLAWEYNGLNILPQLEQSEIIKAEFRVNGTHSYDCVGRDTEIWLTSVLSTGTTWNNIAWIQKLSKRTEYHSNVCGNTGWRNFDVTVGARLAASYNNTDLAVGLYATNESTMAYWKRFRHDAQLYITYNRPPATPTSLQLTDPTVTQCVTGASRPLIADATPTISAIGTDPEDAVQMSFEVAPVTALTSPVWSSGNLAAQTSGSRTLATVPAGKLSNGVAYAWRARGYDSALYSSWSGWCEFALDTVAPNTPTVTAVTTGVQAVYVENAERGGKDLHGSFTFSWNSSTDVVRFKYGFNDTQMTSTATPGPGGTVVVDFPAGTTGPVTLRVKSEDAAGNFSPVRTYAFVVAVPTEDAIWTLDEGTGSTAADSAGTPPHDLTVTGATWGDGPHTLFDSRADDRALVFDGIDDYAQTGAPVVDTTKSFAVSAHVLLDESAVGGSQSRTVLSQDGVDRSGFRLQYSPSCPGMTDGCWSFAMPDAANSAAETVVRSDVPVSGGEWTHLVAEFNAAEDSLQLWVCEIGTPDDPAIGEPIDSSAARTAAEWAASGALQVGRSRPNGTYGSYWDGSIDNLRIFSGAVVADQIVAGELISGSEAKIRRLCQGAEATDFTDGEVALDPTEVEE